MAEVSELLSGGWGSRLHTSEFDVLYKTAVAFLALRPAANPLTTGKGSPVNRPTGNVYEEQKS